MMKTLIVILAIAICPLTASAQTIIGAGSATCGTWSKVRKSKEYMERAVIEFWVLGYISRAASQHSGDMIEGTDIDAIESWLDKYCSENPLNNILTASDSLEAELAARAGPSSKRPR